MATGMFDALAALERGERQDDVAEERRLQFMAQDPVQARARMSYEMAGLAGKGLGQAASALAGRDPRSQRERDVDSVRKAKEAIGAMGDVDMTTPAGVDAYYKGVISVLRENNLPAEAHAAAQEWNDYKAKAADRDLKADELQRKKDADRVKQNDLLRKQELATERNAQLAARGMPDFIQIIDRIEKETDGPTKELLLKHANALIESKKKGVILEPAGDRVIVRDKATGAVLGTDLMGQKPLTAKDANKAEEATQATDRAYRTDMQSLQTVYKAAADLYNSPGLDDLIGKWTGIAAEQGPEKGGALREMFLARLGPAGQEALGLFQQVQGASFLKALRDLKAAGKGSTGLGAVSEVEGNKIQAANGALFPRQQPASFRRKLADFIDTIEATANSLSVEAEKDKIAPIHLSTVPLSGPVRSRAPAAAPTRPTEPQRAPQQPAGAPTVWMTHPTKGRKEVRREMVEEAKRRGYTETK